MIYLKQFKFPDYRDEEAFFSPTSGRFKTKNYRTIYTAKYPFGIFEIRDMPMLEFNDISVFYGNNGRVKSTALNVIAEKSTSSSRDTVQQKRFF